MKIFTANVGVNSAHRFTSPLFDDGTFEFLPIDDEDSPRAVHYRDLRSHYEPNRDLLRYVRERLWDDACHNDPEFETFTYGDAGDNARSSNLTRIDSSDVLLFLARLERWAGDRPTRQFGFYLVGGLLVDYAPVRHARSAGARAFHQERARHQRRRAVPWDGRRRGWVPQVRARCSGYQGAVREGVHGYERPTVGLEPPEDRDCHHWLVHARLPLHAGYE